MSEFNSLLSKLVQLTRITEGGLEMDLQATRGHESLGVKPLIAGRIL